MSISKDSDSKDLYAYSNNSLEQGFIVECNVNSDEVEYFPDDFSVPEKKCEKVLPHVRNDFKQILLRERPSDATCRYNPNSKGLEVVWNQNHRGQVRPRVRIRGHEYELQIVDPCWTIHRNYLIIPINDDFKELAPEVYAEYAGFLLYGKLDLDTYQEEYQLEMRFLGGGKSPIIQKIEGIHLTLDHIFIMGMEKGISTLLIYDCTDLDSFPQRVFCPDIEGGPKVFTSTQRGVLISLLSRPKFAYLLLKIYQYKRWETYKVEGAQEDGRNALEATKTIQKSYRTDECGLSMDQPVFLPNGITISNLSETVNNPEDVFFVNNIIQNRTEGYSCAYIYKC